ncbi:MAG: VOC family protein [Candidatus Kapaibacterium sp.]
MNHPVIFFEIPVTDLERAMRFYAAVFGCAFTRETIDGNEMAFFLPTEPDTMTDMESQATSPAATGMAGALAKGDAYTPSKDGVVIYFATRDIAVTMQRVTDNGGSIHYPITDNGLGLVAEFEDCEGNSIAVFEQGMGVAGDQ